MGCGFLMDTDSVNTSVQGDVEEGRKLQIKLKALRGTKSE